MNDFFINGLESLGWAILHSVWQGGLAFLLVVCIRSIFKNHTPALRYILQFSVLIGCLAAFLITFSIYLNMAHWNSGVSENINMIFATGGADPLTLSQNFRRGDTIIPVLGLYTPIIAILWCLGFIFIAFKYVVSYALTMRLRTSGLSEPSKKWQIAFERLLERTQLKTSVQFYISEYVDGPMTLGFLRPIILVPVGFLSRLPEDQIEAILLHEIAHIRRFDYLFNLFQTAVRIVFFYHPAIYYISKRLDIDREQACDDFAISLTHNPQSLVKGLAALTFNNNSNATMSLAMAASKKDMPILTRLKRLMGYREPKQNFENAIMSAATAILIGSIYIGTISHADAHSPAEARREASAPEDVMSPQPAELPETVIKASKPVKAPIPPTPPKLADISNTGPVDKGLFKKYIYKDKEALKSYSKAIQSYNEVLLASSSGSNSETYEKERLLHQAEHALEKLEDEVSDRRDILEDKYESFVESQEAMKRAAYEQEQAKKAYLKNNEKTKYNRQKTAVKMDNRLKDHEEFRRVIMSNLLKDGLISSVNEIVFLSHPNNQMNLNGKPLGKNLGGKYCKIFEDNGLNDNDIEVTIQPKSIKIFTDYDGRKHKTRITYGEWNSEVTSKQEVQLKKQTVSRNETKVLSQAETNKNLKPKTTYLWPSQSRKVSAEFGLKGEHWPKSHKGIDIPAPTGTAVYATADGYVTDAGDWGKYGLIIKLKHNDGRESLYAHLNSYDVKAGDYVKQGKVIGASGSTGQSTGPHLHFEIRENGRSLNPRNFMN